MMYLYGLEDEEKFYLKIYPNNWRFTLISKFLNSLSTKKQANQNKDIFTTLLCFSWIFTNLKVYIYIYSTFWTNFTIHQKLLGKIILFETHHKRVFQCYIFPFSCSNLCFFFLSYLSSNKQYFSLFQKSDN